MIIARAGDDMHKLDRWGNSAERGIIGHFCMETFGEFKKGGEELKGIFSGGKVNSGLLEIYFF